VRDSYQQRFFSAESRGWQKCRGKGWLARMSRPAEKIALLEASLEKKENDIKVLQLATRRLEEELSTLREIVEEGFNAADQKTEELRQEVDASFHGTAAFRSRRCRRATAERVCNAGF